MTLLEQRYRFVLRMLPASYRAEREEEMVDAFLDGAGQVRDEDNARPSWGEVASVAALAVRARVSGLGEAPRGRAVGDALRLAALLGLGFYAVMGCVGIALSLRSLGLLGSLSEEWLITSLDGRIWEVVSIAAGLVSIAAFSTLALGKVRTAKALAVAGLVYALVRFGIDVFTWPGPIVDLVPSMLATAVPVLALLAAYHRDAPVRRSSPLAALPLGLAAAYLAIIVLGSRLPTASPDDIDMIWAIGWLSPEGLATAAVVLAGLVCLVRRTSPASRLALAIVAVPLMALRAPVYLIGASGVTSPLLVTMIVQCVALLALCVTLATVSFRALPRPA
ncbi:hypothetical protein AB0B45_08475 [Nonomuraea sp. NPDC049152]|uniref:hypothetical protein n=1 Tax=Nonomuraea sp. NPDC049152 TaxID=3154350 RepID=UPI0033F2C780